MQGTVKPSTIGIILGIIIFFVIANQWMSNEISHSPVIPQAAVNPPADESPVSVTQSYPASEMAQENLDEEQAITKTHAAKESDEDQPILEPIYEPPGNSIILVQ